MPPTEKEVYARLLILKYVIIHAISTPPKDLLTTSLKNWSEVERCDFDNQCKFNAEKRIESLQNLHVWENVSPKEQVFLQSYGSKINEHDQNAASWRIECVGMLLWALNLIDLLPDIDKETDLELLKAVPNCNLSGETPKLKSFEEILKKRNQLELWHWRVRTRWLIEEDKPFIKNEIMTNLGIKSYDDIVRLTAKSAYDKGDLNQIMDEDFVFCGIPFRDISSLEYSKASSIIMERHYALNWLCGESPENKWDETPTDT